MATTRIVNLIDRAKVIVQDKTNVRWPNDEWLDWYNDAILAVVNRRPDKSVKNTNFTCDETDSKQTLPADAKSLFTVTRNVASGKPVRRVSREQLDDQYDDWHTKTGSDIDHYVYDERDPKSFYIYPRPAGIGHVVEICYPYDPESVTISDYENDTTVIGVDDAFVNPLLDFMLYRAYSKDSDYAANGQRAMNHLKAFENSIGQKTSADMAASGTTRRQSGES